MEYKGKLYGKLKHTTFDTGIHSDDVDGVVEALKSLILSMSAHPDFVMNETGEFRDMVETANKALEKF